MDHVLLDCPRWHVAVCPTIYAGRRSRSPQRRPTCRSPGWRLHPIVLQGEAPTQAQPAPEPNGTKSETPTHCNL